MSYRSFAEVTTRLPKSFGLVSVGTFTTISQSNKAPSARQSVEEGHISEGEEGSE